MLAHSRSRRKDRPGLDPGPEPRISLGTPAAVLGAVLGVVSSDLGLVLLSLAVAGATAWIVRSRALHHD